MIIKKTPSRLLSPLLMCAAILLLAACGDGEFKERSSTREEPATATAEPIDEQGRGETSSLENDCLKYQLAMERAQKVRLKYDSLFWREPNVLRVSAGFLVNQNGVWTETVGINVLVTKRVDQNKLPPDHQMPDYLESVPVNVIEERPPVLIMSLPENPHVVRATIIWDKYESLFWRQPNIFSVNIGFLRDKHGDQTDIWGIIISVTEKVDQSKLPPEDRIPSCMEGVLVQIIEDEPL